MKKLIFFIGLSVFLSFSIFPQTWTVRQNLGGEIGNVDYEYTIITKQQYDRLLSQRTALEEYATVSYIDELEMSNSGRVIQGTRPKFNGYYYILAKITALTDKGKQLLNLMGIGTALLYGNSNTGCLMIMFANYMLTFDVSVNTYQLGSNDFNKVYNQCIRFVNGE